MYGEMKILGLSLMNYDLSTREIQIREFL